MRVAGVPQGTVVLLLGAQVVSMSYLHTAKGRASFAGSVGRVLSCLAWQLALSAVLTLHSKMVH